MLGNLEELAINEKKKQGMFQSKIECRTVNICIEQKMRTQGIK